MRTIETVLYQRAVLRKIVTSAIMAFLLSLLVSDAILGASKSEGAYSATKHTSSESSAAISISTLLLP